MHLMVVTVSLNILAVSLNVVAESLDVLADWSMIVAISCDDLPG